MNASIMNDLDKIGRDGRRKNTGISISLNIKEKKTHRQKIYKPLKKNRDTFKAPIQTIHNDLI
jgi:hypothetical protein